MHKDKITEFRIERGHMRRSREATRLSGIDCLWVSDSSSNRVMSGKSFNLCSSVISSTANGDDDNTFLTVYL